MRGTWEQKDIKHALIRKIIFATSNFILFYFLIFPLHFCVFSSTWGSSWELRGTCRGVGERVAVGTCVGGNVVGRERNAFTFLRICYGCTD